MVREGGGRREEEEETLFARPRRGRRDDLCLTSAGGRRRRPPAAQAGAAWRRSSSDVKGEVVGASVSGGPLSAIQLILRREFSALSEQEEEKEKNTSLSLLALMQKKMKMKNVESGHLCVCRESTLSSFVFVLPYCRKLCTTSKRRRCIFWSLRTPAVCWVILTFSGAAE